MIEEREFFQLQHNKPVKCFVDGCNGKVGGFLCKKHMNAVPQSEKSQVRNAFKAWKKTTVRKGSGVPPLPAAMLEAIAVASIPPGAK